MTLSSSAIAIGIFTLQALLSPAVKGVHGAILSNAPLTEVQLREYSARGRLPENLVLIPEAEADGIASELTWEILGNQEHGRNNCGRMTHKQTKSGVIILRAESLGHGVSSEVYKGKPIASAIGAKQMLLKLYKLGINKDLNEDGIYFLVRKKDELIVSYPSLAKKLVYRAMREHGGPFKSSKDLSAYIAKTYGVYIPIAWIERFFRPVTNPSYIRPNKASAPGQTPQPKSIKFTPHRATRQTKHAKPTTPRRASVSRRTQGTPRSHCSTPRTGLFCPSPSFQPSPSFLDAVNHSRKTKRNLIKTMDKNFGKIVDASAGDHTASDGDLAALTEKLTGTFAKMSGDFAKISGELTDCFKAKQQAKEKETKQRYEAGNTLQQALVGLAEDAEGRLWEMLQDPMEEEDNNVEIDLGDTFDDAHAYGYGKAHATSEEKIEESDPDFQFAKKLQEEEDANSEDDSSSEHQDDNRKPAARKPAARKPKEDSSSEDQDNDCKASGKPEEDDSSTLGYDGSYHSVASSPFPAPVGSHIEEEKESEPAATPSPEPQVPSAPSPGSQVPSTPSLGPSTTLEDEHDMQQLSVTDVAFKFGFFGDALHK